MTRTKPTQCWAMLWCSENQLDGKRSHIIHEHFLPLLFKTRQEARREIASRYRYIKLRPDLRTEPHGWKMPVAIPVLITPAPAPKRRKK